MTFSFSFVSKHFVDLAFGESCLLKKSKQAARAKLDRAILLQPEAAGRFTAPKETAVMVWMWKAHLKQSQAAWKLTSLAMQPQSLREGEQHPLWTGGTRHCRTLDLPRTQRHSSWEWRAWKIQATKEGLKHCVGVLRRVLSIQEKLWRRHQTLLQKRMPLPQPLQRRPPASQRGKVWRKIPLCQVPAPHGSPAPREPALWRACSAFPRWRPRIRGTTP